MMDLTNEKFGKLLEKLMTLGEPIQISFDAEHYYSMVLGNKVAEVTTTCTYNGEDWRPLVSISETVRYTICEEDNRRYFRRGTEESYDVEYTVRHSYEHREFKRLDDAIKYAVDRDLIKGHILEIFEKLVK